MRKITILTHAADPVEPQRDWIVVAMADAWTAMGHSVEFVRGTDHPIRADLVIPHVDLTVLPPEYVEFLAPHENVVNRRVVDISKRSFSRLTIGSRSDWDGPVIVKTNRNYGGLPERKRLGRDPWRQRIGRKILHVIAAHDPRTGFHPSRAPSPDSYPIFDSVADLPRGTFLNPQLHVERFLPEREDDLFCLRCYAFAGSAEYNVRIRARRPVIKSLDTVDREEIPVPDELRAVREELGFDFGKFDHVVVDGKIHLLDINRTPTYARRHQIRARQTELTELFARGLLDSFGLA
ncbi:MAG: hypothetical protein ACYTGZ_16200 [Planctomycetota bacterium]